MTKQEMIDLLQNARAVPDNAEVVFKHGSEFFRPGPDDTLFLVDQFGQGTPGGLG